MPSSEVATSTTTAPVERLALVVKSIRSGADSMSPAGACIGCLPQGYCACFDADAASPASYGPVSLVHCFDGGDD